ncbi:unnamed protein product [Ectocarpus sp. 12 AP-2014]
MCEGQRPRDPLEEGCHVLRKRSDSLPDEKNIDNVAFCTKEFWKSPKSPSRLTWGDWNARLEKKRRIPTKCLITRKRWPNYCKIG